MSSIVIVEGKYINAQGYDMTAPEAERFLKELRKKIDEVRRNTRPRPRSVGDY